MGYNFQSDTHQNKAKKDNDNFNNHRQRMDNIDKRVSKIENDLNFLSWKTEKMAHNDWETGGKNDTYFERKALRQAKKEARKKDKLIKKEDVGGVYDEADAMT